ncbi:oxidoreductase, SDR family [Geotalea daltonii FRC-32]|uniref:Oxidoreductase, SDR family n=1 Tax=Geotalea daltonii (strain DSM 22248 / JCM 15807 / FRC-32) TaxID=316067 RepID=B9M8C0_GEODF|nr:glucose 1-dehydrogenase [Geotalea daltonii]ACM20386.1 oxidoreductase, SDR family [Geotalea daltonii FRC-32]
MKRLEGKIAIITGAARGIGEAIARAFVAEGAFVYLTDIKDKQGAIVSEQIGNKSTYRRLDVREETDWQRVTLEVIEEHGRLDIAVNNAGITGFEDGIIEQNPEHASLDSWHDVHRTNLDGVFLGCKYAIQAMRKTGMGSIINISSRSGLVGIPGAAAYASSKAAVRNHSKTVALYCAEQCLNIRCNSIHPAAILTPMWEPLLGGSAPERAERMKEFVKDTPLRRFGTPEEVAAVAVLLASDEAAYMTGTELNIDGGMLAGSVAIPVVE